MLEMMPFTNDFTPDNPPSQRGSHARPPYTVAHARTNHTMTRPRGPIPCTSPDLTMACPVGLADKHALVTHASRA